MKVLLIEDEVAAAARLKRLIREFEPGAEILDTIDSVEKGIEWLNTYPHPDLIFSDIQLADGNSFEIFASVKPLCPVIFITAFDTYAIDAFKVHSIDYLLKPVNKEQLKNALEKFREISAPLAVQQLMSLIKNIPSAEKIKERFLVRYGQKMKVVSTEEIHYFYTDQKTVFAVTRTNENFPIDHSLEELEQMLNPQLFFRVNRQFIVRVNAIMDMVILSKSRLKLLLDPPFDTEVIVSSEKSAVFKTWLGN